MIYIIFFVFFGIPALLTLANLLALFFTNKIPKKIENTFDILIFLLGIPYTLLFAFFLGFEDWNVPLYESAEHFSSFGTYTPLAFESLPTVIAICIIALVGYGIPRIFGTRLSPVIAVLCYSAMFLGIGFSIAVYVQFGEHLIEPEGIILSLLSFNYIVCCIRLIRKTARLYASQFDGDRYDNPILRFCSDALSHAASFILVAFILTLPLIFIIISTLLLFGQRPDSIIRAFTETAEWTLSEKIPPPRLEYDGHYLCTVAACGDEKVVKPLRAGRRHGQLIVVNRQLLVANAFEDLIAERTPRFHRLVRGIYDRCGLPISKYINTKKRSNAVYFLMKPLEWIFTAVLYTFDQKPENRIAVQYTK